MAKGLAEVTAARYGQSISADILPCPAACG